MTQPSRPTPSEKVRARLDHPVIDADGHFIEFRPALARFMADEGIDDPGSLFMDVASAIGTAGYDGMSPDQRARRRAVRTPWWAAPAANTLDLATATLPGLLHQRLEQLGIDFAVLYPSAGLVYGNIRDERGRRAACRAVNRYSAQSFAEFGDRITPAAVVPMHTPEEAIEELEWVVGPLGLKAVMISGFVERPVEEPDDSPYNVWWDSFGIDSAHDYDPFWRRCTELGVSVASHSGSMGVGFRRSISNYMYNHIGHFGAASEALVKSLFMAGVTRRFPELRLGLLEGGVHWGVGLYADLVARWEKRNLRAVQSYDPARIDQRRFAELLAKYGGELADSGREMSFPGTFGQDAPADDFAGLDIGRAEEIPGLFVPHFYFGCEADDPMVGTAFDRRRNPFGAEIRAMFSSDIGHWDVPEMTEVLEEAYEGVENGGLTPSQFRDFTFSNVARFYTDSNPDFFRGTSVERAVAEFVARERTGSGDEASAGLREVTA